MSGSTMFGCVTDLYRSQSNCWSKFWLEFIVLLLLFICTSLNEVKMVNSYIVIGCTNHAKPGSGISFHAFPYKNSELLQKWIQAVKRKKTRYKTSTALSVVTTLNYPVLLSDQEKLGTDCMTIQLQQFSLPFLHTTKKSRGRENCKWKGCMFHHKSPVNLHHQKLQR